jgi:tRNA (guanine37-N1)-methyltransferase
MRAGIVTLFPDMFTAVSDYGVTGRAIRDGLVEVSYWNPRDYTEDKHRTVDDRPYGGGPGMLMKTEPIERAVGAAKAALPHAKVIYLTPQGRVLDQTAINRLASEEAIIMLCGRYEGIDERVIETQVDEEWSLGDYVLSGGELAAMACLDAIIRLQSGALGSEESAGQDSFMQGLLDCPHYTRPEHYAGRSVPGVLLSGDHEAIRRWRHKQSVGRTWQRRPELLEQLELTKEQQDLLKEFIEELESGS